MISHPETHVPPLQNSFKLQDFPSGTLVHEDVLGGSQIWHGLLGFGFPAV
jgi:hypothetical protein